MKHHFDKMSKFKNYCETKEDPPEKEISEIIIHCADLSGPTKTWKIAEIWSRRCNREF